MKSKLTVIGAGISGQGLALLASELGADVFVSEKNKIPDDVKKLFTEHDISFEEGHSEKAFQGVEAVLLSSGLPPNLPVIKEAEQRGIKLVGELDFVLPKILSKSLICVTGSNGKSTVTALIGHMLKRADLKTGTGGNLGTAAATFTREQFDAVVLELSSFQLARATGNLRSNISIVTNLAPDHIDWHGSYEDYVAAKAKILSLRAPEGWGIVQDRDVELLNLSTDSKRIITLSREKEPKHKFSGHIFMDSSSALLYLDGLEITLFDYDKTTLLGSHNFENIAMSLCAVHLFGLDNNITLPDGNFLLEGFRPLPHRCENVRTLNGVMYVDDSKGTNVAASITAMQSISRPKVVILGGQGKGEDYLPLAQAVRKECEAAVLIGSEAGKINEALVKSGFRNIFPASSMDEAVSTASRIARPGMCVLLSPACTSWDMYKSYKARGEHFCKLVMELQPK